MTRSLWLRLSAMMFLQYFILGSWAVTLPTYLMATPTEGGLNLSARDVGLLYGTMAIGATVSPFLVGLIADRLFAGERVLVLLHTIGAAILLAIAVACVGFQDDEDHALRKLAFVERVGDEELWRLLWHQRYARDYLAGRTERPGPPVWMQPPYDKLFRI